MDVKGLQARLRQFADERDWDQFHNPKNLAAATSVEAGELLEIFQWLTAEQASSLGAQDRTRVEEELADVAIYLIRLADVLDVDLEDAVVRKIERNASKYPVELARGNATRRNLRGKGGEPS